MDLALNDCLYSSSSDAGSKYYANISLFVIDPFIETYTEGANLFTGIYLNLSGLPASSTGL
jgi:hypothetical protein